MKPNLVVLRTGPDAAYRQVVDRLAEQSFDVGLSWNGTAAPQVPGAVFVHAAPGARWAGLAQTLALHQPQWAGYQHVWLPDDGLQWVPEDISRLFSVCEQLNLELAQPAYTPASPGVAPVSLQHDGFQVRFTDLVDAAAPVFSRTLLQQLLPALAQGDAGHWARQVAPGRVAIVDATTIVRVAPGEPCSSTVSGGLNFGGLLDNGDAICFGERAVEVAALLQTLMRAADSLPLDGAALARYLARHLELAASSEAASLPARLEHTLAAVEMRFNVVLPSAATAPAPVAESAPAPAPDLALLDADLRDLRARHAVVTAERDQLAGTLAEVARQLQQALPAGRPAVALVA